MATKRRYFGCTGSLSRKLGYYIGFARVLDEGLIYRSDYRYSLIWEVRKLAVLELFLVLAIYFSASGITHYFFGTKAPFGDFFYSTAAVGLFYTFFYFYLSYYSFFFSSESSLLSLLGENFAEWYHVKKVQKITAISDTKCFYSQQLSCQVNFLLFTN